MIIFPLKKAFILKGLYIGGNLNSQPNNLSPKQNKLYFPVDITRDSKKKLVIPKYELSSMNGLRTFCLNTDKNSNLEQTHETLNELCCYLNISVSSKERS
jgi:hypothetical protein